MSFEKRNNGIPSAKLSCGEEFRGGRGRRADLQRRHSKLDYAFQNLIQ